ncbi:alpha-mannosyltransferase [Grosmannia clavigera kw1407]|uniref:Mannosyltransferase n=1 Tax=Grosmannia clavigera (strain kw1407 / UAMH 11150) TaxID=655863 RepID=F0XRY6_GROCL|nr:alpha-mannosyltransferase [Grosmannia clavigera kw1407]EFW99581.1 alpha-mannosyltransferase [Grosmannia clavigera kw1407]
MKSIDAVLCLLVPALVLLHLAVAPYTKVEESFNVQAAHDVLVYGMPTGPGAAARLAARFDHVVFPGAVPRTFVGAVVLAGLSQPAVLAVDAVVAAALLLLTRSLGQACGWAAARWYLLLQLGQFHVFFYASRTLPNMFAFFLTTLAFAFLLNRPGLSTGTRTTKTRTTPSGRLRVAVCLFVLAAVVFRAEVALLLAAVAVYLVAVPMASIQQLVRTGTVAVAAALLVSVPLDTFLWQRPLPFWPELHGFVFNVLHGQASAWGTSPWHYYFSNALPRLLLNPLAPLLLVPLALVRPATRGPARLLVFPSLAFVAVYSLQPHKEARFILYVVPPLTAAAALGADQLVKIACKDKGDALKTEQTMETKDTKDTKKTKENKNTKSTPFPLPSLLLAAVVLSVPLCFVASTAMLLVSALNYPGGEALAALRDIVHVRPQAAVAAAPVVAAHVDVLACMTGVTLFGSSLGPALSLNPAAGQLVVDKTEDVARLRDPTFWMQFDYVIAEPQDDLQETDHQRDSAPAYRLDADHWQPVAVVHGFAGIELLRPGQNGPDDDDEETTSPPVVGHGATVALLRRYVRSLTGGWWIGPRMLPRLQILKHIKADDIYETD